MPQLDTQQEVVSLCQELVKARSYSGQEDGAAEVLRGFFNRHTFDDIFTDGYGNIIGHIKGSRPGKRLLFDGHIDTVPVTDPSLWRHDPFGGKIEDGRIYGRGTSDMKGAVAAMACAAAAFADACQKDFAGDIFVAGVVHEECFEGVAARAVSTLVKPDYVVIGEASELNLKIGQRGRAEIQLETKGISAHSANPHMGLNAVYKITDVIQAFRQLDAPVHPVLGAGIMELTDIKSSPYPGASVVPEYCKATYDRRLLVGETPESVLKPLKALLREMMQADPTLSAEVCIASGKEKCYTGASIEAQRFFPAWFFDEQEPFIQSILAQMHRAGFAPAITHYDFCTNGSHYAGEAGIATIGLGPSLESLAHTVNEYIEISQLVDAVKSYNCVLQALLQ